MTDLSSWTAYFQDFGQFFNGFLFTLALAIGSFILAMVLESSLVPCQPVNVQFYAF
ncbi:polar amino acid ABC transporter permease [Streptococcus pneumoniae]|nr:polar amino acid ABC transporter permease [Streptococcus pneumoniae]VIV25742.1 polar amino acid ABC transporter permease [Streptococcus pneumoniae]VIV83055.1 polar amino acid ABC transporter permease [Streptococcus pneumoniae]VOM23688.1 polar amino acid ABC transporter permease [Streptococcus pneumoniae]VSV90370.1 polar amino acid ABC transporter permease [Streptococcus pneumoniae]